MKRVGIMTIGDEVLQGRILDKNKANIGQFFLGKGAEISLQISPPDNAEAIERALLFSLDQVDLLVITGGLGETRDDLTYSVTHSVLSDYEVELIPNLVGAATGYHLKNGEKRLILLPGPPNENLPMLRHIASSIDEESLYETFFHLSGIGEYALEKQFDEMFGEEAKHLATYVSVGFVSLRVFSRDEEQMKRLSNRVRDIFGEYIFYEGELDLEEKIFARLKERKYTLSCVESATAGSVLHSLTKLSGSSEVIYGGYVVYQQEAKEVLTGLSKEFLERYTTVSVETSEALAKSTQEKTGTDFSLALTGYAQHEDSNLQGRCYVSIATPWGIQNYQHKVGSWRRASARNAMRLFALSCLWKTLAQEDDIG